MGQPSVAASNALIYVTYGAFLYGSASSLGCILIPILAPPDIQIPKGQGLLQWPGSAADRAISYLPRCSYRIIGLYIAYLVRRQTKGEFLSSNGTQKG